MSHQSRQGHQATASRLPLSSDGLSIPIAQTPRVDNFLSSEFGDLRGDESTAWRDPTNGLIKGVASTDASGSSRTSISFGGIDTRLPIGANGLFVASRDPGASYFVERNPLYQMATTALGTDYLTALLGHNADPLGMRLGDASYEAWLVKQQLLAQTGNTLLKAYANADAQMRGLMDSAHAQSDVLGLKYGVALTRQQQEKLQRDLVWMVAAEVEERRVLVPVVYLAQGTKEGLTQEVMN